MKPKIIDVFKEFQREMLKKKIDVRIVFAISKNVQEKYNLKISRNKDVVGVCPENKEESKDVKLTITGTFDVKKLASILEKHKKGEIDAGQAVIDIIESDETVCGGSGKVTK